MRIIGFFLGLALVISGVFVNFPAWAVPRDYFTFGEGANVAIGIGLMIVTFIWDLATTGD